MLSAETTSDEENVPGLESQTTTPKIIEEKEKETSLSTTSHHPIILATPFLSVPTTYNPPSNHLKRKLPNTLSAHMLSAKVSKASSLPQLHDTYFGHPPPTPNTKVGTLPRRLITNQAATPLHISTVSQTRHHAPFSSHGKHPNTLTHYTVPPRKPLLPITDSSGIEDWALVDDALHTQIATYCRLPSSAQCAAPWEPEGAVRGRTSGVRIPLTQFADLEKESKGKARAVSGWTAPRWSNVGEFKARLDMMYGPGDINRGLGRGPKSIQTSNVESDIAPEQPTRIGLRDPEAAQGSALTEDEDDPEMSLRGMRRGRLENPSPQRDTRAFRRHGASGESPEIE